MRRWFFENFSNCRSQYQHTQYTAYNDYMADFWEFLKVSLATSTPDTSALSSTTRSDQDPPLPPPTPSSHTQLRSTRKEQDLDLPPPLHLPRTRTHIPSTTTCQVEFWKVEKFSPEILKSHFSTGFTMWNYYRADFWKAVLESTLITNQLATEICETTRFVWKWRCVKWLRANSWEVVLHTHTNLQGGQDP